MPPPLSLLPLPTTPSSSRVTIRRPPSLTPPMTLTSRATSTTPLSSRKFALPRRPPSLMPMIKRLSSTRRPSSASRKRDSLLRASVPSRPPRSLSLATLMLLMSSRSAVPPGPLPLSSLPMSTSISIAPSLLRAPTRPTPLGLSIRLRARSALRLSSPTASSSARRPRLPSMPRTTTKTPSSSLAATEVLPRVAPPPSSSSLCFSSPASSPVASTGTTLPRFPIRMMSTRRMRRRPEPYNEFSMKIQSQ